MEDLILIGGGGHCLSCIDVIESIGFYRILGVLDKENLIGTNVGSYKVIGSDDLIGGLAKKNYSFLVTVGQIHSSAVRNKLFEAVKDANGSFATVVSPRAYVSKTAKVGDGTIVMHDAIVNCNTVIQNNCIVNSKSLIEHGCIVGEHSHISTGAIVNGDVKVGKGCFVGSHSTIVQGQSLPDNTFVKAGEVYYQSNNCHENNL